MDSIKELNIKGKTLQLPVFFPDATRAVIRSVSSEELAETGTNGIIVNTYHLLSQPGMEILTKVGGVKNFMHWDNWVISDSGGFQIFSLVQKNPELGSISKDGVSFYLDTKGGRSRYKITPEKCIQIQFEIGSDIMIVLDYFTPYKAELDVIKKSVDYTIRWAKRCKDEFLKQCLERNLSETERPLLFGVVQGGHNKEERSRCAIELEKIGFDGYGLGGWVFDENGKVDYEIIKHVAEITPSHKPRYGLGVGTPQDLVDCVKLGYGIFDCVLPTRDARHQRLYVFNKNPDAIENIYTEKDWYSYLYINKSKFNADTNPISEFCDCYACQNYSRAYLNHLFRIGDALAFRLATIHNLRMYAKVIELLQKEKP